MPKDLDDILAEFVQEEPTPTTRPGSVAALMGRLIALQDRVETMLRLSSDASDPFVHMQLVRNLIRVKELVEALEKLLLEPKR